MKILCFGDSNTYGFDPRGFLDDRYELCWCDHLARDRGWEVFNGGSNGRIIPGSDRWMDSYLAKFGPIDLVIVMLGSNDILRERPVERILSDMAALLDHIRSVSDARVLLLSPPPIRIYGEDFTPQLRSVTDGYRILAQERNAAFADVSAWDLPLAYDGIHFSEEGHRLFAQYISELERTIP